MRPCLGSCRSSRYCGTRTAAPVGPLNPQELISSLLRISAFLHPLSVLSIHSSTSFGAAFCDRAGMVSLFVLCIMAIVYISARTGI